MLLTTCFAKYTKPVNITVLCTLIELLRRGSQRAAEVRGELSTDSPRCISLQLHQFTSPYNA